MNKLENLVEKLSKAEGETQIIESLQEIEHVLISNCVIDVCGITIEPLWVEAYFYEQKKFPDCNTHLSEKQKNRFGQLYFHQTGRGGVDICLSNDDSFYLSFLLKASVIDGVYKKQIGIYDILKDKGLSEERCEAAKDIIKPKFTKSKQEVLFAARVGLQKPCYSGALIAAVPLKAVSEYKMFEFARESLSACAVQHISEYIAKYSGCTKKECRDECQNMFGWIPDSVSNLIKELK